MLVVKGTVSMSCPHVMYSLEYGKRDNYYYYYPIIALDSSKLKVCIIFTWVG